jgi:hypothetical protein
MNKKWIHIWYTKAGGGHESMAKTLKNLVEEHYPEYSVRLIDLYEKSSHIEQTIFQKSYPFLVSRLQVVWWFLNVLWRFPLFCKITLRLLPTKSALYYYKREKPSIVVSTYYDLGNLHGKLQQKTKHRSKLTTVVSDIFSPMRPWFLGKSDEYIVFSEHVLGKAKMWKIHLESLHRFGLLINPKFLNTISQSVKSSFRQTLELSDAKKTILLLAGGEGLRNGKAVFANLLQDTTPRNIIVVCGRDEQLKRSCMNLANREIYHHSIHIYGFSNQLFELINCAEIVITKAGPASILENISQQKPLIICDAIWPQEMGNVEFVVNNSFGIYEPKPRNILKAVQIVENFQRSNFEVDFESDPKRIIDRIVEL